MPFDDMDYKLAVLVKWEQAAYVYYLLTKFNFPENLLW